MLKLTLIDLALHVHINCSLLTTSFLPPDKIWQITSTTTVTFYVREIIPVQKTLFITQWHTNWRGEGRVGNSSCDLVSQHATWVGNDHYEGDFIIESLKSSNSQAATQPQIPKCDQPQVPAIEFGNSEAWAYTVICTLGCYRKWWIGERWHLGVIGHIVHGYLQCRPLLPFFPPPTRLVRDLWMAFSGGWLVKDCCHLCLFH